MISIKKIIEAREGGAVERCHTTPHIGEYSNAKHQWGAAMLYLQLRGATAEGDTVTAILTHDLGERWAGDVPAPAKWALSKSWLRELERNEKKCLDYLGIGVGLSEAEWRWVRGVDLLDLFLWAHEQVNMGNRSCERIIANILAYVYEHHADYPGPIHAVLQQYRWERTGDNFPS